MHVKPLTQRRPGTRLLALAAACAALGAGSSLVAQAQSTARPAGAASAPAAAPAPAGAGSGAAQPAIPVAAASAASATAAAPRAASGPTTAASPAAASAPGPAVQPGNASKGRDIVVDAPAAQAKPKPVAAQAVPRIFTSPLHDAATAAALSDLGLSLLRHPSQAAAPGSNQIVSPLSLASAMGVVQVGAGGATQTEIDRLLNAAPAADGGFARRLPSVLARLPGPGGGLSMANRLWVNEGARPQPGYDKLARERYAADAATVQFADPAAAAKAINGWVGQRTAGRIPSLLTERSLQANTQAVVVNAVHFKRPWADAFDAKRTQPLPFRTGEGASATSKNVPTMVDDRTVMRAVVDNVTIYELPFAGGEFSLMLALPPAPHTLQALESDLSGLDVATWAAAMKPMRCVLQVPKFSLRRASLSVKPVLADLGVRAAFSAGADFRPMLGEGAREIYLSDVVHAATLEIDEAGGEGSAATAAVMVARSVAMPAPTCAIDRPFFLVLAHKPTGAPVFVGRVTDPTAP